MVGVLQHGRRNDGHKFLHEHRRKNDDSQLDAVIIQPHLAHVAVGQQQDLAAKVRLLQDRDRAVTERVAALPDGGVGVPARFVHLNAAALLEPASTDTRLFHDTRTWERYQELVAYLTAHPGMAVDARLLLDMHDRLCGPEQPFGGRYKRQDVLIHAHYQGRNVVAYVPPGADETPEAIRVAFARYARASREAPSPVLGPLCLCLDLLCIHPFEDGNGRVMRLLLLYLLREHGLAQAMHLPFEGMVARHHFAFDSATRRSNGVRYYASYDQLRPAPFLLVSVGLLTACYDAMAQAMSDGD